MRPVKKYAQLVKDLNQYFKAFNQANDHLRDLFVCYVASAPKGSSDAWPTVRKIVRDYALRQSYPHPLYELFDKEIDSPYIAWVARMTSVNSEKWKELRDQSLEYIGPFSIFESVGRDNLHSTKHAGDIAQFTMTWHHFVLDQAIKQRGHDEILQYNLQQLKRVAANVIYLNKARYYFMNKNYVEARKYTTLLWDKTGEVCGIAFNDASRLSLLCGDPYLAADIAQNRIKFAPWDLTAHANLVFAYLTMENFEAIRSHLEAGINGKFCHYCSYDKETGGIEILLSNPLLTIALAMFVLACDDSIDKKNTVAKVIRDAIRQKMSNLGNLGEIIANTVINCLTKDIKPDEVGSQILELEKLMLAVQKTDPELWKESEGAQRVIIACKGAFQGRQDNLDKPYQLSFPSIIFSNNPKELTK